jgi:hypothetical protein
MELFEIGRDTVFRWKRLEEKGKLEPKKSWGKWRKIDPVKLREQIKKRDDATLEEVTREFGVSAEPMPSGLLDRRVRGGSSVVPRVWPLAQRRADLSDRFRLAPRPHQHYLRLRRRKTCGADFV